LVVKTRACIIYSSGILGVFCRLLFTVFDAGVVEAQTRSGNCPGPGLTLNNASDYRSKGQTEYPEYGYRVRIRGPI